MSLVAGGESRFSHGWAPVELVLARPDVNHRLCCLRVLLAMFLLLLYTLCVPVHPHLPPLFPPLSSAAPWRRLATWPWWWRCWRARQKEARRWQWRSCDDAALLVAQLQMDG